MSINVAVATHFLPEPLPNQLHFERVVGPTVMPAGPSAGRRGAVVALGFGQTANVLDLVEDLWARNVNYVLFSAPPSATGDSLMQQVTINALADRLLDRAERHGRHLEFELETVATMPPIGPLRLNIARFTVCPLVRPVAGATVFEYVWQLLRTERAAIRLRCANMDEIAEADRWLLALAANPDGELTRSDHRIRARRRWLDLRTWIELTNLALLPAVIERRWHLSPNLWDLTMGAAR
jgi:hypothetical protein